MNDALVLSRPYSLERMHPCGEVAVWVWRGGSGVCFGCLTLHRQTWKPQFAPSPSLPIPFSLSSSCLGFFLVSGLPLSLYPLPLQNSPWLWFLLLCFAKQCVFIHFQISKIRWNYLYDDSLLSVLFIVEGLDFFFFNSFTVISRGRWQEQG